MRWCIFAVVSFALTIPGCNNEYLPPTSSGLNGPSLLQIVSQAASDNHVPAALVYAVLQTESGGDPNARSVDGAMGLMQLMPATAQECGIRHPFDPRDNVECGASYLSRMLARFGNNMTLAIAAYRSGPGAVARYHGVPPQAQSYVQRVMTLYRNANELQ
ncbi:MAG: lytic transglycosylase domain-containing protein [Candidatus Tyrphobacter sp.]